MKVVKCVVLLVLVSLTSLSASAKNPFDDVVNSISSALKTGTSKGISATFMNSVSLSIKRDERVYTRFQAELLLDDFFRSNKVSQLKELQRAKSSANSFVVFSLRTSSSTYRVFVKLVESNNEFKVSELRIE
ncbi:DUF4783 domain-containing protein [Sphingobacterium psychroaquaticum]|uniref:Uncharacterized protein n=1 Tax=Sphingobacterium psychroaquaticum TaxID=561061 RepID=A0A1X7HYG9_9SPHI|nr:DUF4783 domain-containing protein [Sphingobacterium psychroaquaticum]QBQ42155.1 DUF4783 domain-containing protein [Sphingobacterium psychroaquaticum]SMG06873.1 protein of unknown function [Sphingobacterium psychroaquaticum]